MSKGAERSQQRINAMLRVFSIVCIIIGGLFIYFTASATLIPQLVPIFYFMAATLIFMGAIVLIARFD